jgi:predicted RNase H-like HicB family nuclease
MCLLYFAVKKENGEERRERGDGGPTVVKLRLNVRIGQSAVKEDPMNLPNPYTARHEVKLTLMLEPQTSGNFVASVLEFPSCREEANTRDGAIAQLEIALVEKMTHVEVRPWSIVLPTVEGETAEPAWAKFAGIFKDNPMFDQVMEQIQADRDAWGDEEIDPSEYQR